jgi:HEAT repeat protein
MTCELIRKQFPLYLYGELTFEEEEVFEQHMDDCSGCRVSLEAEERIQRSMAAVELRPTQELLERCRLELPRALRHAGRPQNSAGLMAQVQGILGSGGLGFSAWLKPAGAVALVAVGFFAARWTGVSQGQLAGSYGNEPVATQVRYVEPSDSGMVRIVVDETRQREMHGSLEDEAIRTLLLTALRNPSDPGVRAESLDLLKAETASQEVRNALLYALENDPNDGVRLKALEGLRKYSSDAESRRVLSRVLLTDKNPGMRSEAIDLLVQTDEQDVVDTLQQLLRQEDNSYVRMRSQKALEEMNASLETF